MLRCDGASYTSYSLLSARTSLSFHSRFEMTGGTLQQAARVAVGRLHGGHGDDLVMLGARDYSRRCRWLVKGKVRGELADAARAGWVNL